MGLLRTLGAPAIRRDDDETAAQRAALERLIRLEQGAYYTGGPRQRQGLRTGPLGGLSVPHRVACQLFLPLRSNAMQPPTRSLSVRR